MLSDDLSLADYAKGLLVMYALLDTMLEERSSELAKIKAKYDKFTRATWHSGVCWVGKFLLATNIVV